jgi:hypothetical protein
MFRNSYKQANDSIHPIEDLLQEMQRRQTQQKPLWKAPARWGTLAACVLVMISLGVWLLGQSYGNKKDANDTAQAAAQYKSEEKSIGAAGFFDASEENASVSEQEEGAMNTMDAPTAAVGADTGTWAGEIPENGLFGSGEGICWTVDPEACLLLLYDTEGNRLGELYLPELGEYSLTDTELQGNILWIYTEGGSLLVDISDPASPQLYKQGT